MASGVMTTAINSVAMIAAYPIYLHFLGYEKYGVWLVLATLMTFAQLGNLGIGPAVMKLVAEEYGRGDIEGIQRYVTTALALLCISGTVGLIVLLILKHQIIAAFNLSDENAQMVSWLLPYVGVLSIYVFAVQVFEAALSGLRRMDLTNYIQSLGRVVQVVVAGSLLGVGLGVKSLLIGGIASYLVIHVATLLYIQRIAPLHIFRIGNLDARRSKRLLCFGGGVLGGSIISMLFSPFNKLMLSRYAGVATVPIYEIAFTGSMQVRGLIEAAFRALVPEISRIGVDMTIQARDRISQIYRRSMRLIFLLGTPLFAVLAILAPVLLKLWLRDRFVETLPGAFRIMLIGSFVGLFAVPAYYTLMGMGHIRYNLGAHIVQATINLILVLPLLLTSRVTINTIASTASTAIVGVTLYLLLQKRSIFQQFKNEQYQIIELK